jgi:hypothetical protein
MDFDVIGLKDYLTIGLIMGLLKFASMRIIGHAESDLTWWESYGIWTVLSLLSVVIHFVIRRFLNFISGRSDAAMSSQARTDAEIYEGKR